jgi:serine/threonine protein kinase
VSTERGSDGPGGRPAPLLAGRYQIRRRVDSSAVGNSYMAYDAVLRRQVSIRALDLLDVDSHDSWALLRRFHQEGRAAAGLQHRLVLTVFDVFEVDRTSYIVTELLPARSLAEILRRTGRFAERRALSIIRDVCEALEYTHSAGVFHQDIAARNVLMRDDETIKVVGFGFARVISDLTTVVLSAGSENAGVTAEQVDSVFYTAPEQLRGVAFGAASDVYSAGVLLYQLLVGAVPFLDTSPTAVLWKHVLEPPPSPSSARPGLSARTDEIVHRALAKQSDERHQTARELRADIAEALAALEGQALRKLPAAGGRAAQRQPPAAQPGEYDYDLAFSFSSESRDYVERIKRECEGLGLRVFYDRDLSARWWGANFLRELRRVYSQLARYFVPFISAGYFRQPVPADEFEVAMWTDVMRGGGYILPVVIGDVDIPPDRLPPHRHYLTAADYTPAQLARQMLDKVRGG